MSDRPAPPSTLDFAPAPAARTPGCAPEPARHSAAGLPAFISACRACRVELLIALVLFAYGVALRLSPHSGPSVKSLDETFYAANVKMLREVGLQDYPTIVDNYIRVQSSQADVILPPTRCLYISLSYLFGQLFHTADLDSLRSVSATFSILTLLLSGLFAARLGDKWRGLAVLALMAVAPVELQMAHRELVDGFFAFWATLALWLLWENLQQPRHAGLLAGYAVAIAAMVLTKENSFFAFIGLAALLALAPSLKLGTVTREVLAATVLGGLLGVVLLTFVAGGLGTLVEVYRLLVTKAEKMDFAYETGGGPWFRYLVDLMLMSPAVLLPAIAAAFNLRRENKAAIAMVIFIAGSYLIMANVRNGMNLRYATMWDMPMRYLAVGQLFEMSAISRRRPRLVATALVALVALIELHQYYTFFVKHYLGELVTAYLMQALEITKKIQM